ncbi:hypothetical protein BJX63DRAFT_18633 [Aspergillus granulosus]|uniref:Uncharacterized protein n=1 Tax=Aspergillus granulosus TaxID=176169 RepID=A0ABR4H0K5_9EURO
MSSTTCCRDSSRCAVIRASSSFEAARSLSSLRTVALIRSTSWTDGPAPTVDSEMISLIPLEWVWAPPKADGVPEPLKNSSDSNKIPGVSGMGEIGPLLGRGGDRTLCVVDTGREFCRGGVPISGEAPGIAEERRLVGRYSDIDMTSRLLGRWKETGDSVRRNGFGVRAACSRHFARSSSNFCDQVASLITFCSAISCCTAVSSSAAFLSLCSAFCSS